MKLYATRKISLLHVISKIACVWILGACQSPSKTDDLASSYQLPQQFQVYIDSSRNSTIPEGRRMKLLAKASHLIDTVKVTDSTKLKYLSTLAFHSKNLSDTLFFSAINKQTLQLAIKIKDTFGIADAHWNYGAYYISNENYELAYFHYRKAYQHFKSIDNKYYEAKMLYNMSFIKGRLHDYTGSEILIVRAIDVLKELNKPKLLFDSYKHLAVLNKELEEFDRAVFYNNKAIEQLDLIGYEDFYYEGVLNNIGIVLHHQKEYDEAVSYFNKALDNLQLPNKRSNLYARLLDNRAYSNLLGNNEVSSLETDFLTALEIREQLDNSSGIIVSKLHLSEYYQTLGDSSQSRSYALAAANLAKNINNIRDYLTSLHLLVDLDPPNTEEYLQTIIRITDSINNNERKIRNKFTRIDFETDEYILENQKLEKQKIWLLLGSIIVILLLSLVYFLMNQISKNRLLKFESEQRKSNEKIYLLALNQQKKLEEGRYTERKRISEELHDGILGKLFGARLNLGFLKSNIETSSRDKFTNYLDELQTIEKEIREISHTLNAQDTIQKNNFENLLNNLIYQNSKLGNFNFEFNYDYILDEKYIDQKVRLHLYRIVQEALQNIVKYAQAKHVVVDFSYSNAILEVKIIDDGRGFSIHKITFGIGIKNMKSRIKKLQGTFTLKSTPKSGTMVTLQIPIHQDD